MRKLTALLLTLALAACSSDDAALTPQASPAIRASENTTGSPYVDLQGATLSGGRYIHVPNPPYLERVGWLVDGKGWDTDRSAPWSLNANDSMFNTARLADGQHTITARYFYRQGKRRWMESVSATFTVANSTARPEPAPAPEPTDPRGTLVFAEEFSGASLNRTIWDSCYPWGNEGGYAGFSGSGNCYNASTGEEQLYVDGAVTVSNGTLKLTAKRERVTANGKTFNYTSGMIASHPRLGGGFMTQYGYVEARIKVPSGKGFWPAFWTLPFPVKWPPEIDIVEVLGDECNAEFHLHPEANYRGTNVCDTWHTYAVDWQPGRIIWYLDGVERYREEGNHIPDEPMYLLLNLAVGGTWPGSPDGSTPWPGIMEVDYVRVYR